MTSQLSGVLVRGQLKFLKEEGFDVVIGTRLISTAGPSTYDDGVRVRELPYVRQPSLVSDLRAAWATWRLIRELCPSVVNASTPKAGLIGTMSAWLARVPVRVYVVRGLRFETARGWRRRLLRRMERTTVRFATHVLFNGPSLLSVAERERVIKSGRGVILASGSSNGIALERFTSLPDRASSRAALGIPGDADVVGFVGRISEDKGIGDLIEALSEEFAARPSLHLLIVGPFEDESGVAPHVRARIVNDPRIVHIPWLDNPGLAYRAMDIFAFPSYREGLPNAPLEAQLCERVVVGYAATGTVDAVIDGITGVLVPVADIGALSNELKLLLDDDERRERMGRSGHDWVAATFNQDKIWSELAGFYRAWVET